MLRRRTASRPGTVALSTAIGGAHDGLKAANEAWEEAEDETMVVDDLPQMLATYDDYLRDQGVSPTEQRVTLIC